MSAGKIKNLVIVALALINVFLIATYAWGEAGEISAHREMIGDLCAIMRGNGISLSPSAIGDPLRLAAGEARRDESGEDAVAQAVLGACEKTGAGNISRYESELGTASFNGRGEFIIELLPAAPAAADAESSARRLLRAMGIETAAPSVSRDGDTAYAICMFEDAPVFNCQIRFDFKNGSLAGVSGRRSYPARDTTGDSISGVADALLGFLAYVKSEGIPCGAITGVDAGYQFNVNAAGTGELSPGWRVVSNTGEYFVYSGSGAIERAVSA
ncbi:MAG: hypothetical protein LBC21_02865 [Oscillospiraceae bacterium]|jgi:hypothetical protein|nr:hypothetical protein [Oscillospiraceae bacterium]